MRFALPRDSLDPGNIGGVRLLSGHQPLDRQSTFHAIQGCAYALRKEMLAYPDDGKLRPAQVTLEETGRGESNEMPQCILPAGTRLRASNAIGEFCESGGIIVFVEILDGPLAGNARRS